MLYLVGWDEPEAVLTVHHSDDGWIRTLFVQPKDTLKEIWEGRRPGVEGALKGWSVDAAHSCDDMEEKMNELLSSSKRVLMRTGIRSDLDSLVMQSLERRDRARQHFGTGPTSMEEFQVQGLLNCVCVNHPQKSNKCGLPQMSVALLM